MFGVHTETPTSLHLGNENATVDDDGLFQSLDAFRIDVGERTSRLAYFMKPVLAGCQLDYGRDDWFAQGFHCSI